MEPPPQMQKPKENVAIKLETADIPTADDSSILKTFTIYASHFFST